MPKQQFIIYADESTDKGEFYSHFYGAALIKASDRETIESVLNLKKEELTGLEEYQIDNQYFLLYYQLIKHAFGLRYCNSNAVDNIGISVYLDDVPDTKEKFEQFKDYTSGLSSYPPFKNAKVAIQKQDITDVRIA